HHMHLGTRQPQIGRMEQPVRLFGIRRGFPPPLLDDHITAPVAVNVTETEPVRKDSRSGHILAADGVAVPRGISYLRRASEPDHLSSIRIAAQNILATVAIDIDKCGRLITCGL